MHIRPAAPGCAMAFPLLLTFALASTGCLGNAPEVGTTPLDLPPAEELLPEKIEGYSLGYATRTPADGSSDSDELSRIFDGRTDAWSLRLSATVSRHAEVSHAVEEYASLSSQSHDHDGVNATDADLGDASEAIAHGGGWSHVLLVRKASVVWFVQHSSTPLGEHAEPPAPPDLVALLEPYVERVPPREPTPSPSPATPDP